MHKMKKVLFSLLPDRIFYFRTLFVEIRSLGLQIFRFEQAARKIITLFLLFNFTSEFKRHRKQGVSSQKFERKVFRYNLRYSLYVILSRQYCQRRKLEFLYFLPHYFLFKIRWRALLKGSRPFLTPFGYAVSRLSHRSLSSLGTTSVAGGALTHQVPPG